MTEPTTALTSGPMAINRELVAADLEILTDLIAPLIEARLDSLASYAVSVRIPILGLKSVPVGQILRSQLKGSPRSMVWDALVSVLDLSDDALAAMVDVIGQELGAWRFAADPVVPGPLVDHASDAFHALVDQ